MALTRFLLPYFVLMNVVLFLEINLVLIYKRKILPTISYSNWGNFVKNVSLIIVSMIALFAISIASLAWPREPLLFFMQDLTVVLIFFFQLGLFGILRRYLHA